MEPQLFLMQENCLQWAKRLELSDQARLVHLTITFTIYVVQAVQAEGIKGAHLDI